MKLWLLVLAALISPLSSDAAAQGAAQVRGVWILPNQFRNDGDLTGINGIPKDDILENQGKRFLAAFKSRAPSLQAKTLAGADATRQKVIKELRSQLEAFEPKNQPCMFVVYYGGHGIRPSSRSKASTYLALQGAETASIKPSDLRYEDMILLDEVFSIVAEFEHVYFQIYLDCCYSANTRLASDLTFTSEALGNNGFAICSSTSDRKAIATNDKSLTLGLIEQFESNSYLEIESPAELYERLQASESSKSLAMCYLPWNSGEATPVVQWPLSKLCYLVIDFGRLVSRQSIAVKISDAAGTPLFTKTLSNGNQGTLPVLMRSIAVPRSKILIQIRISGSEGTHTLPALPAKGYSLSLSDASSYHFLIPRSDLTLLPANELITANAITDSVDAILARGSDFGITTKDTEPIILSALATAGTELSPDEIANGLMPWAKTIDSKPYDADFQSKIAYFTGSSNIPLTKEGFDELASMKNLGIAYTTPVAEAYALHISENVTAQIAAKTENSDQPQSAWISNSRLTSEIRNAAQVASFSNSHKSYELLESAIREASDKKTRILSMKDQKSATKALRSARSGSKE